MKLIIIFFLAIIVRLWNLTDFPPGLMQDEVVAGYDAFSILQTGRDHHGVFLPITFNTFNDWASPFLNYYLVPFVALLGLNPFSIRFAVVFLSLLSLVLFYFVAQEYFKDKFKTLIAFFLLAFSSYAITTARWTIPTHTIVLPFLLFLFFIFKGNPILSQLFLGVSVYTDTAMKLFALLLQIPLFVWQRKKIAFPLVIFALVTLPTFLDHLLNFSALNNRFNMISIFTISPFWPLTYLQNYLLYLSPIGLFLKGEVNPVRTIPGFGYEHLIYGVFFYMGLFLLSKKVIKGQANQKEKFLLFYFLFSPLATSFTLPPNDWQRTLYALPGVILIAAEGFSFLINKLSEWISQKLFYPKRFVEIFLTTMFTFLVLINLGIFSYYYFGKNYSDINKYYFQYGLGEVFSYLLKIDKKYQAVNITNTINMPYIYYLFYNQYDPHKLIYSDFSKVDENGWTKVERIGKYHFKNIKPIEIKDAKLLREITNSPVSKYQIWERGQEIFVDLKINSTSEVEHGYTSGYL